MNIQRKNSAIIIAFVAVAMLATGCKKEQTGKTVTLGVSIASNNSKVYIDGFTPKWQTGDQVSVNGTAYTVSDINGASANISDVTEADVYRAVYPASIVTSGLAADNTTCSVNLPLSQTYSVSGGHQTVAVPMSGATSGSAVTFYNLCSVLKVTFSNNTGSSQTLKKIRVTAATSYLSGSGTAEVTGSAADKVTLATGQNYVDLDMSDNMQTVADGSNKEFYIVLPEFGTQNVTIEFFNNDGKKAQKGLVNVALGHNKLVSKTCTVNSGDFVFYSLSGEFSISSGSTVRFSPGNLKAYNATANSSSGWEWSFHGNQWGKVGNATANTKINGVMTVSQAGYVDLFGWVGSAADDSYDCYGINNSTTPGHYNSGAASGALKHDWGTLIGTGWRTMIASEWAYLLNTRTTTSGIRYAKAVVGGVNGLIILPDDWSTSYYTLTSTNTANVNYTTNTISLADWNNSLESHGAVFLPSAGFRNGVTVTNDGQQGHYWSSTSQQNTAKCTSFSTNYLNTGNDASFNRYMGLSVRLVQVQ